MPSARSYIDPFIGQFLRSPLNFLQHKFHKYPAYSWSVAIAGVPTLYVMFSPGIRRAFGLPEARPRIEPPKMYPIPNRARQPVPSKYDD